eukprot:1198820-Rhodomonas_salina.3
MQGHADVRDAVRGHTDVRDAVRGHADVRDAVRGRYLPAQDTHGTADQCSSTRAYQLQTKHTHSDQDGTEQHGQELGSHVRVVVGLGCRVLFLAASKEAAAPPFLLLLHDHGVHAVGCEVRAVQKPLYLSHHLPRA